MENTEKLYSVIRHPKASWWTPYFVGFDAETLEGCDTLEDAKETCKKHNGGSTLKWEQASLHCWEATAVLAAD